MAGEATNQQGKPKGTGRFIHELQKRDILNEDFLSPARGLLEVELWLRSAALYLKFCLAKDLRQLNELPQATPELAQAFIKDLQEKADLGTEKYGEALRAFNGRDALVDAYQETLDGWAYLRQRREEVETRKLEEGLE